MSWLLAPKGGLECGYCSRRIAEGQPVEQLRKVSIDPSRERPRYRCEAHAHGPVDWAEIQRGTDEQNERQAMRDDAKPTRDRSFLQLTHKVRFDPKLAAANERDSE